MGSSWTFSRSAVFLTSPLTRKKRERERERQNGTPVIAQTWWKKLLQKFFSWTLNRLLFLRMSCFKWTYISKKWFSRLFLCSGNSNFYSRLELNNHLYSFWTEIIDLFAGLFGFKMRANNTEVFSLRLQ